MKKFALVSLGCPKNEVDSERILAAVGQAGYVITDSIEEADILAVNTCAFIRPAVEESYRMIRLFKKIRRRTGAKIIVCGCLGSRHGDVLFADTDIDAVISPPHIEHVARACDLVLCGKRYCRTGSTLKVLHPDPSRLILTLPYGYLKISEGCDNRCSYCTIPQLRGNLHSFPEVLLVNEARQLFDSGVKELILVGQDITAYGTDSGNKNALVNLIRKLLTVGFPRLRLLYVHPARIDDRLISIVAENRSICRYLDMPLQHINPLILKNMGRPVLDYRSLIERLRAAIPDLCIRTTFIVGFPGETEKQFMELIDFVKETKFDRMGAFAYSPEQGTRAYNMPGHISEREKKVRLSELMSVQRKISEEKAFAFKGKTVEIIVDRQKKRRIQGRTEWDAPLIDWTVSAAGTRQIGDFVTVFIKDTSPFHLSGDIVHKRP